jgi:hypothetical protein
VWDPAGFLAAHQPDPEPPGADTPDEWLEAQIFAGVRACVAQVGNLDREEVVRPARLVADLGLE